MNKGELENLREAWKKWNAKCHPEDQIDWEEYYDEHKK